MDENAKKDIRELPEWTIPVTWEMCGKVKVRAATIEEAMEIAKDEEGVIPLPDDGDYEIGKYGYMRLVYLKEHRKILYTNYVTVVCLAW